MGLSSLSVRRPVTTVMIYAGVVFLGVVSFRHLSVDFLPPVSIPRLTVHAACPELSPEEIDDKVAQPIATVLGGITGVKKTSCISRRGTLTVNLEFSWGVDMDYASLEVREKLDQLGPELPREAGRPTILRVDPETEAVMTIGVTSTSADPGKVSPNLTGLTETCNALLKKRLEQVEGVAQVQVFGGVEREIRVETSESKMAAVGLTIDDVARAIGLENVNVPMSTIRSGSLHYPVRLLAGMNTADDVARLSFPCRESGRTLRVADIATVIDTIRERGGWTRYNGRDILVLQVKKEADANTLTVSRNVRNTLVQLEQEYPALRLHLLGDQAEFLHDSVADVEQSILWGALLAFLVLFLFLRGVRDPCIVGLTIPVSLLASLAMMSALGISLNVLSLTGLALGIGMLGDNAIIVVENVRRLRDEGYLLTEAIEAGSREINLAVTASTMTNVAVFLPVLFVRTVAQQLFVHMAVTMTVSLLASLFVAVTLVPVLLAWERDDRPPRAMLRMTRRMDILCKRWQERMLLRALKARGRVLLFVAALLAASILAATLISSEPAPEIDRKRFAVRFTMQPGTSAATATQLTNLVEGLLLAIHGVTGVYMAGGMAANPDFWSVSEASTGNARLEVTVNESAVTRAIMEEARKRISVLFDQLAGVTFTVTPSATTFERILRPEDNDIAIRIQGGDPSVCNRIAEEFARRIRSVSGLVDSSLPSRDRAPEYRIRIDRHAVARYAITPRDVAEHISGQTSGEEATELASVDRQTVVRVLPENLGSKTIQDLLSSYVICRGARVPLSQLVHCSPDLGRTEIRRVDGTHTVVITANTAGRSIGAVADDLREEASRSALPPGYRISIGGENELMESSFRSLGLVIALSLVVVYMILAAEYESLVYPFVILLTSPLAFIGAVLAMLVAGEKYNVMSLVGMVIMIGAVDNDAVIAVDVITALRRKGMALQEAVCQGMLQRLRPILMTAATTLLGILPLMLNLGRGSELVRALTVPLAGGLISSTLFVLVVIPVVYTYVDPWAAKGR
jgi:hydrophobic/amphiphilic exporter-1 (mainly G- bacteria), HAE1 family